METKKIKIKCEYGKNCISILNLASPQVQALDRAMEKVVWDQYVKNIRMRAFDTFKKNITTLTVEMYDKKKPLFGFVARGLKRGVPYKFADFSRKDVIEKALLFIQK